MKTFVDTPAVEDLFHIEKYVNGLSEFIVECDTPMTIAIQGDWGSGKTSLMKMVDNTLRNEHGNNKAIVTVWFNTWQFSQFNLGDQLPILMMTKLINSLGSKNDTLKKTAAEILSKIGDIALSHITGGSAGYDTVSTIVTNITNGDLPDQFDRLRTSFQDLVSQRVGNVPNGRVVFFIDDLDRLNPGKAVELLEVLKIFLECERCVFVLAIDYDIVVRGIREKYGDLDEEKGRAFFDKIIQVPFRMPLENYHINEYVASSLRNLGITAGRFDITALDTLLVTSVGNNPRSIKRIFNSYLLLRNMNEKEVMEDPHAQILLFGVLCMQNKFPKLYSYIVAQRKDLSSDLIQAIRDQDTAVLEEIGYTEKQFEAVLPFYRTFYSVIDINNDDEISPGELSRLGNVLGFSEFFIAGERKLQEEVGKNDTDTHKVFWQLFQEFISRRTEKIKRDQFRYSSGHFVISMEKNFRLDMSRDLRKKMLKAVLYIDLGDRNKSRYQFLKLKPFQDAIETALEKTYPETETVWDRNNKDYPRVTFSLIWPDRESFNNINVQTGIPQFKWFMNVINTCTDALEGTLNPKPGEAASQSD